MADQRFKLCPNCHTERPLSAFTQNAGRPSGVNAYCKPCHRGMMRAYRDTPEGRESAREAARKYRAKKRAERLAAAPRPESPGVASRIADGAAL